MLGQSERDLYSDLPHLGMLWMSNAEQKLVVISIFSFFSFHKPSPSHKHTFLFNCFSFPSSGDWTQGLTFAGQVIYHWSHTSKTFCFSQVSLSLPRLVSNLWSSCSASRVDGITGLCHHAWLFHTYSSGTQEWTWACLWKLSFHSWGQMDSQRWSTTGGSLYLVTVLVYI
jgi:hypothetical protein